jgi:signal transduction histidine kinase
LSRIDGFLHIKIHDNGVGLVQSDLSKKQSFGLLGMRERIKRRIKYF